MTAVEPAADLGTPDPTDPADPAYVPPAPGPGTEPVTGPTPPADQSVGDAVGRNWVAAMLVGATCVAGFGLVVALLAGGGLGAVVALVATAACLVAALVESHSTPLVPGWSGARLWYYSRIAIFVLIAVAAAQFDARDGAGSVGWHIPTSMVTLALVALWWRDPQRPV